MTSSELANAISVCQSLTNKECIYDFAITGQNEVAASTLNINTNNVATSANLGFIRNTIFINIFISIIIYLQ